MLDGYTIAENEVIYRALLAYLDDRQEMVEIADDPGTAESVRAEIRAIHSALNRMGY